VSINKRVSGAGKVSWYVRWYESGRESKRRQRAFGTKRDAQLFEADLRRQAQLGAHAPGWASDDRLREWLETWGRTNQAVWAPSTAVIRASNITRWITPYIGDVRLRDLGPPRLREWRDEIVRDGATPMTVTNVMKTLSSALGAAVADDKLPSNPLLGVKRLPIHREPRPALSPNQAERIRAALPSQRDRVLWGLLCLAGLRTEDALALRWSDVIGLTPTGATLKIDRTFVLGTTRNTTKTGRGRDVPVIAPLAADLVQHFDETLPLRDDGLICVSRAGTPLNLHNWRMRVFRPAREAAGVPWATPYTGRHTYISFQIHAGLSPVTIAAIAGNSPDVIWKHYAREFERSRTTKQIDLEAAIVAARREVWESRGRTVDARPLPTPPKLDEKTRISGSFIGI